MRDEIASGYDTWIASLEEHLLPVAEVLGVELPEADSWRAAASRAGGATSRPPRRVGGTGPSPQGVEGAGDRPLRPAGDQGARGEGTLARRGGTRSPGRAEGRSERPVPVRQRQEVEEVLRARRVISGGGRGTGFGRSEPGAGHPGFGRAARTTITLMPSASRLRTSPPSRSRWACPARASDGRRGQRSARGRSFGLPVDGGRTPGRPFPRPAPARSAGVCCVSRFPVRAVRRVENSRWSTIDPSLPGRPEQTHGSWSRLQSWAATQTPRRGDGPTGRR